MNATVIRVVPLQFTVPLLILGNLGGNTVTPGGLHSAPVSLQLPSTLPANYTAFPAISAAYKFVASRLSWNDARQHCVSEGGHLAVLDSQEKFDLAATLGGPTDYEAWIGIHNLFGPNEWVTVKTESPVKFFSWHPGFPMDLKKRRCVAVCHSSQKMQHANAECTLTLKFFCEISL